MILKYKIKSWLSVIDIFCLKLTEKRKLKYFVQKSKSPTGQSPVPLAIEGFIFNWRGQLKKSIEKEQIIKSLVKKVTVINSDDDNQCVSWINVGEEAYFSKQFVTALAEFDGDIFFHIQGDASFHNWEAILVNAKLYFEKYNWGVYAPNVNYTFHVGDRVNVKSISFEENTLSMVTIPDTTCWFIHKDIIDLLKTSKIDISTNNKFGWGIDWIICTLSYQIGRPVIRDYEFCIDHPRSTGYNMMEANTDFNKLTGSLDPPLRKIFNDLYQNHEELHANFQSIISKKNFLSNWI